MSKTIHTRLIEASDTLELAASRLEEMKLEDKIDLGARIRLICKAADTIDKEIKASIKRKLKNNAGTVYGLDNKAVLKLIDCQFFNSSALKEADPKTYDKYVETRTDQRINYEAR